MPTQLKRRTRRAAVAAPRKVKTLKAEKISRADVAFLTEKAEAYRHSEEAWQRLSTVPEEDDKWSAVEEHLLAQADHSEKWKYFSK